MELRTFLSSALAGTVFILIDGQPLKTRYEDEFAGPLYNSDPLAFVLARSTWYLTQAASSSPDAPAPVRQTGVDCIRVHVTDTGRRANCVFNTYNHTVHEAKVIQMIGLDSDNKTQIYTIAPAHGFHRIPVSNGTLILNSMVRNTACWYPGTRKLWPYHITMASILSSTEHKDYYQDYRYIYVIGINTRVPAPEFHTALLSPFNHTEHREKTSLVSFHSAGQFNLFNIPYPERVC